MEMHYGSGYLYGIGPSGTPVRFGVLDEVDIDFTFTEKPLYGQWVYPVDVGRGSAKVTGKIKTAQVSGRIWNDLIFGQTLGLGGLLIVDSEAGTVTNVAPYEYTVTNATTFSENLGVRYAATGLPLTEVTGTPSTAGEYSVSSGGVYTFSATDTGASIIVSYSYTSTTVGASSTVSNVLQGSCPAFGLVASEPYQGESLTINLYRCKSNKLTLPIKQDDYMISEVDFSAMANASGGVFEYAVGEEG